jgi:uncharacterized glyoxalase superfamily protein PhnB
MSAHELFAYLRVHDARAAIAYYCAAFGATERFRLVDPEGGRIGHAELSLAGSTLMLSDEYAEMGLVGPRTSGDTRTTMQLHLHVDDADATLARAVALGGTLVRPASDQFYGERSGLLRDPFGHEWSIGHSLETLTPAEMQRRWDALVQGG